MSAAALDVRQIIAGAIAKAASTPPAAPRYAVRSGKVYDVQTGRTGHTPATYRDAEAYARSLNDAERRNSDPRYLGYWEELALQDLGDRRVIANGQHYILGDEAGQLKGHSGRKFRITFFTGARLVTTNLWHQGAIPNALKPLFPENATIEVIR